MSDAKLSVALPPDWALEPHAVSDTPYTFTWRDPRAVGPLQVSLGLYRSGQVPNPSQAQLESMAREFGAPNNALQRSRYARRGA